MLLNAWGALDYRTLLAFKCLVASAGGAVLLWDIVLRARGRAAAWRRTRDALLGTIGLVAFACWWNLGRFHQPEFVQVHEHYHYYLGARYFPELGFTRLYQCTAAADIEDGFGDEVAGRWIRNLATNELQTGRALVPDPVVCRRYFTAERWELFKRDVRWFRHHRSPELWNVALIDHGYNATPVWRLAGGFLAGLGPASDGRIHALALLDPAILAIMWGFVWWAFGWRTMCVALVWWGTNFPARYYWTGGAFLRTDWLACLTIAICLARRGRAFLSGLALTGAALLRIFPGLVALAIALREAPRLWRARTWRPSRDTWRMALGCALALVVLLGLTAANAGGVAAAAGEWKAFAANSRKHLSTPATNSMGLTTVMSYQPATTTARLKDTWVEAPWDTWIAARHRVFAEREALFVIVVAAFVVLLARAVRGQDQWVALVLGVGLIPVAWEVTCYYYAALLVFAFLWTRRPWVGVALCALSAVTSLIPAVLDENDDIYAAQSVAVLCFLVAVTMAFARRSRTAQSFEKTTAG